MFCEFGLSNVALLPDIVKCIESKLEFGVSSHLSTSAQIERNLMVDYF